MNNQQYIDEILKINSFEVDELFDLRDRFLYGTITKTTHKEDSLDREEAQKIYQAFIDSFWSKNKIQRVMEIDSLLEALEPFPDIRNRIKNIKNILDELDEVGKIQEHRWIDSNFISIVQQALILPSDLQSKFKSQYLTGFFENKKNRRAIRTAKIIKKKVPTVYQAHKLFFNKLIDYKEHKRYNKEANGKSDSTFLVFCAIAVIAWGMSKCL